MEKTAINELSLKYSYFEVEAMSMQVKSFIKSNIVWKLGTDRYLYNGVNYDFASLLLFFFENRNEFLSAAFKWERTVGERKRVCQVV